MTIDIFRLLKHFELSDILFSLLLNVPLEKPFSLFQEEATVHTQSMRWQPAGIFPPGAVKELYVFTAGPGNP